MILMHCPECDRPLTFGICITHHWIPVDMQVKREYPTTVNPMFNEPVKPRFELPEYTEEEMKGYYWPA